MINLYTMKSKNLIFAIVAICTMATACKKNNVQVENRLSLDDEITNYMARQIQTFTVDPNLPQVLIGKYGTQIHLSGNNFCDSQGNALTGNVEIKLIEIYSKSKMILANKVTLAYSGGQVKPLISGGEFYLTVTQNGQKVNVINPITVQTKTSNSANENMSLFAGEVDENGNILWFNASDSTAIVTDSLNNTYYGFPFENTYSWINCDYFMGQNGPQTAVSVTVPNIYHPMNTKVYIVFTNENAVTSLYSYENEAFKTGGYYTVPTGMNVHFVVVTNQEGRLMYAVQNATLVMNHNENITSFTEVSSFEELELILDGIF
jgi:hypothetical protein